VVTLLLPSALVLFCRRQLQWPACLSLSQRLHLSGTQQEVVASQEFNWKELRNKTSRG
jgi:hypothetical protein